MAGLAVMITAVALTVMLPVAGLLVSLGAITLLRAADRAQSTLAARRSVRGPRPSDLLVVVVTAPLAVARALFTEALMAPLALMAAAATYVVTVAVTPGLALPRAGAYAAAAIVAWYGVGPGSHRPRRQLDRMAGAVARTPWSAAVIALALWALAIGVAILAVSQTPYVLARHESAPAHAARLAVHHVAPEQAAPPRGSPPAPATQTRLFGDELAVPARLRCHRRQPAASA